MRIVLVALVLVGQRISQEIPFVFGVPKNLGPVINTSSFDGGPSLSADGLTLQSYAVVLAASLTGTSSDTGGSGTGGRERENSQATSG